MHNHFSQHLNLEKWILERRPKVLVECGAGYGDLTKKIAKLLDVYDFEYHVISDQPLEEMDARIKWVKGLSYVELEKFGDKSIDFCIIDTDHNYWTLMKELSVLFNRMSEGGLIAMHDVVTFYHDTGMAMGYMDGQIYPKEEIEKCAPYGSLGDALIEFLFLKKLNYKLLSFNNEHNGAALIEKSSQSIFSIVTPGPGALFGNKEYAHA